MTAFTVDSNGNRIKTDILVSGWIRELGKKYSLLIPRDINTICFMYWLITICDKWDHEYINHQDIEINGQVATRKYNTDFLEKSLYGWHVVDKGSYRWQIKFKTHINWICIGIIRDDDEILKEYESSNQFYMHDGCFLVNEKGNFWHKGSSKKYCSRFDTKHTVITMTLNMDKHTLSYRINDKDYGIATDKLDQNPYRFAISFFSINDAVELL